MARQLRIEYAGAFYHVTSRGNEKKRIYSGDKDKEKFLAYLKFAHERFHIIIHAYCLMPNHYHLLIETPLANLSRTMQFINSSYTTCYNAKRKASGHLFQGRYKAILIDKDSYVQELSRYIHLNPVRAKIVRLPEEYPWSSYKHYISSKRAPKFLDTEFTLKYFGNNREEYRKFVKDGIAQKIDNPFKKAKAKIILGNEKFVKEIKEKYLDKTKESRDLPSLRELGKEHISAETVIATLKEYHDLEEKKRTKWAAYFIRRYTGRTLREISEQFFDKKLSLSAIDKIVSRVEDKRQKDKTIDEEMKELERKMSNVEV